MVMSINGSVAIVFIMVVLLCRDCLPFDYYFFHACEVG